jgi:hypothetical protein
MDPEGRWLLEGMQQTSARVTPAEQPPPIFPCLSLPKTPST